MPWTTKENDFETRNIIYIYIYVYIYMGGVLKGFTKECIMCGEKSKKV